MLHLGRQHGFGEYTIGGTVIVSCNVVRDLGIQVDSHLKFHEHAAAVTKKLVTTHSMFSQSMKNCVKNVR